MLVSPVGRVEPACETRQLRGVACWRRVSAASAKRPRPDLRLNVAGMGYFSSDRAIREYAEHIWKVKAVG